MQYENPLHKKHCNEPNCKHPIDNTEGRLYTCKFHLDKQLPADFKAKFIEYAVHSDTDECIEGPFRKDKGGYPTMGNTLEGEGVHRQVLILKSILDKTLPKDYKDLVTRHAPKICHNPFCINPKHLSLGTPYDNYLDAVEDGTLKMLDPKIVMEIYKDPLPTNELAEKYNVSKKLVSSIKTGSRFSKITGQTFTPKKTTVLDDELALEIFNDPLSNNQLVKKYGIEKHTISNIKVGKTYGHVTGKKHVVGKAPPLSDEKVLAIYNATGRNVDIAREFGVSTKLASKIRTGITRSALTGHKHVKGKKDPLNAKTVMEIFNSSDPQQTLADRYGVNQATISEIKSGKNFSEITGKQYKPVLAKPLDQDTVVAIYLSNDTVREIATKYQTPEDTVRKIRRGGGYIKWTKDIVRS